VIWKFTSSNISVSLNNIIKKLMRLSNNDDVDDDHDDDGCQSSRSYS
jgi:hypothetical protein